MRNLIKFNLIGLLLIFAGLVSCDLLETAEQDASPVSSPDGYPVASFTSSISGTTVTEGDTVVYTITTDRMIDRAITFDARLIDGNVTDHDYAVLPAVLQPYSKSVKLYIIFFDDGVPMAASKTAKFEIGVYGIAEKYLLNPSQQFPTISYTIKNYNDPTLLTIIFNWDSADDIDIVTWSDTPEYPATEWGDKGATTAKPEIDKAIWLSDPKGTYYVDIMDWDAPKFNYTFTLGHPDGSVQTITGTFDRATKNYTVDNWTAWGGSYPSYRVLKVVNDGTKFVVTKL